MRFISTHAPGEAPREDESYVPEVRSEPVGKPPLVARMLTVSVPGLPDLHSLSLTDVIV